MININNNIHIECKEYEIDIHININQKDKDYCMPEGDIECLLSDVIALVSAALNVRHG